MRPTNPLAERRQSHRIKVCGIAVLRGGRSPLICRIADLSTGGIALRVENTRAIADISVGDLVHVDLQLDPRQALRVTHEGTVRHIQASTGRVGIGFTVCPAALQAPRVAETDEPAPLRVLQRTATARWARSG